MSLKSANKLMVGEKSLLSLTFSIAVPLALQSLIGFAVNMMDTVMLGQMGDTQLSASSQANQIFFIISLAVAGIADGANVLVAQAWGKKDMRKVNSVLAYTYRVGLGFIVLMSLIALIFPTQVMTLYAKDADVIAEGAIYLRIVAWSYLAYGITTITTGVLRAVHTVKIAMIGSAVAMVANVVLNYVLIFGKFGAPKMGIAGAAVATLIARILEVALIIWFVYFKEDKLKIRIKNLVPRDKSVLKPYIKTSAPIIINELFWGIGESLVAVVMGQMGKAVVSANSICGVMNQLASVMIHGITAATCVVIGNTIGASEYDKLPAMKKYFQKLALIMGVIAGVLIFAARAPMISLYNVADVTKEYANQLILITALIQPFQSFQITNMTGILRGGGDTTFAAANDLIFLWLFTVPLGFITGLWLKLPVYVVFICLRLEKIGKAITSEIRLRSGKWIHNMVSSDEEKTVQNATEE